jgi:hypothetical protein
MAWMRHTHEKRGYSMKNDIATAFSVNNFNWNTGSSQNWTFGGEKLRTRLSAWALCRVLGVFYG